MIFWLIGEDVVDSYGDAMAHLADVLGHRGEDVLAPFGDCSLAHCTVGVVVAHG